MRNLLFLLIGLAGFAACQKEILIPKPDAAEDQSYAGHPRHAEYQAQLDQYRRTTRSPGAILLIHRKDEALWIGASGSSNLEHQTPMRTNTQFRIGSITKMLVSTVVLQLAEQNQLSLDDKLSDQLPKVMGRIPDADKITIRHLLGHLSGIYDPTNESSRYQLELVNDPDRIAAMSADELMEEYVYGRSLHFTPGTGYAYSNVNYWLLGQIAEKVSGKKLQQLLQDQLFTPLGMQQTYLETRDDRNVARSYADLYGDGHLMDVTRWEHAEVDGNPAGGIVSTAEDLLLFTRALMEGQLLRPASLALMQQVQLAGCNDPYCESGLGLELWRTGAGIAYGKNGSIVGTEANAVYFPASGNMFVIYKNNGNGSDKSFLDAFMD